MITRSTIDLYVSPTDWALPESDLIERVLEPAARWAMEGFGVAAGFSIATSSGSIDLDKRVISLHLARGSQQGGPEVVLKAAIDALLSLRPPPAA